MGILYLVPLRNWSTSRLLVKLFVVIKSIATIFLLTYFLFIERAIIVLLSGVGDGLLALLLWWVYRRCPEQERPGPGALL